MSRKHRTLERVTVMESTGKENVKTGGGKIKASPTTLTERKSYE